MLRRSPLALLGLFVCLFAAHLSSASSVLRLDESRIRVSLDGAETRVIIEADNGTGLAFPARLSVELLDPHDRVRASAVIDVRVRRGANSFDVPLKLPYTELSESDRAEFPWYRLRYKVEPAAGTDPAQRAGGVVSISEITPDLFELRVVSSRQARAGSSFRVRVRTANPVTQRPVKGVAIAASLTFDAGKGAKVLKSSAVSDGDGFATLDFQLPRAVEDDGDAELKVTAQRGTLVEKAEAEVSVEQSPHVLLTTDKPLYQPGQTVHMRALVFDQSEHALAAEEVTFKVEDEEESAAFDDTLKTSRFGVASADWRIPESTRLGTYTLKLVMEDDRFNIDYGARIEFKVSRYDLPNFSVETKPDRSFYLAGENPEVEVRADYLFGQPVRRGHVRVVRQTERRWNYKEQKYEIEEHPAVEGELDERGRFLARLDLSGEHKELAATSYQRFRDLDFVAYVSDPTTNRTEQRRFSLRLSKEPVHVYVNEGRFQQAKGLPLAFYVSTFYADGRPAECDVTVFEEGEVKVVSAPGEPRREVKNAGRAVASVQTNRYGVAKVVGAAVRRDEGRSNIPLRFVARDREGREGQNRDDFWLGYYGDEHHEIRVETDKTIYRDGEPVTVELASDTEHMSVVVDAISEGRVLFSKTVRLSGGRASLLVPANAEFRDAVTLSAMSTAPSDDKGEYFVHGARTVVFPRDRELKLDVRLSQKSFRPGEEAGAQFALHTADGRRAAGALGVVVFDKAVEERARTDGESGRGFGFADSFYDLWYGEGNIAGITRRDIERLDPARTPPEGLETVAEMLFNYERPDEEQSIARGTEFARDQPRVFSDIIGAQLKPLNVAVNSHYSSTADYPANEAALVHLLAEQGIDFATLRDPWGQPYSPRFYFEREVDRLDLYSNGADERAGTDDDFSVAHFMWPYFRATGERVNRAVAGYHKRTGGFVRDLGTLSAELRRDGLDLDSLRDRWGRPYRFDFDVSGTNYVITIESGGPNKAFEPWGDYASDDFAVWVQMFDYFADARTSIEAALAKSLRETGGFPRAEATLRNVLAKSSINLDALRDGWGRPVYATFSTQENFKARLPAEDRRRFDPVRGTHRESRPITRTLNEVTLRSTGPDGRAGTADDFTLAYFTDAETEQTARNNEPKPAEPATTTFSGGTGAITGTITDPVGAVIPGVSVNAKHDFAALEFSAKTNEEGIYLLRDLPSGVYTLTFNVSGFQQTVIDRVRVQSSNLTKVDAMLNLGAITEAVTVTGDSGPQIVNTSTQQLSSAVEHAAGTKPQLSTPRLREFFPETLVWQPALETDSGGNAHVSFKLADNITTWKMSVIASTEDGKLGIVEREFLAFQPFFIEHDPPRVLTEGDEISLPVVLRNYLERAQGVDVELKPESWFSLAGPARQHAEVPASDSARPIFDLRAVASVREGKQRVTAIGADASDAVEKPVTVHPDGEERAQTDAAVFADAGTLNVSVPAGVVSGSVRGELKIYPNLAAHVLEGVEAIMKRPYGCGEQTISSTYPSVLVLNYYERAMGANNNASEPPIIARARSYAQLGYERLLGYRAPGGGFTYWGRGEPDLALTAYALRFLSDASRVIKVDEDVVRETREWLIRQQREDGSWPASSHYQSSERKAGMQTALTTAFIARVLAATQKKDTAAQKSASSKTAATVTTPQAPAQTSVPTTTTNGQQQPLQRALRYLDARAAESDEPYLIASFALAAADAGEREAVTVATARLRSLAHEAGPGTSYWSLETSTPFYGWGLTGRIETTALAVQALNAECGMRISGCGLKEDESRALTNQPSVRQTADDNQHLISRGLLFLLRNKDRYGVWYSTQATVNVFDALLSLVASGDAARSALKADSGAGDTAEVYVGGRRVGQLVLPPEGRLTAPLTLDLSPFLGAGENRVEIHRPGNARQAQAQLVATYYVPWSRQQQEATDGNAAKSESAGALRLSVGYDRREAEVNQEVTCNVVAERTGRSGYGMMLAEVGLPPGSDVDRASLERTMQESDWAVSSYDVLPDRLVVYLWPRSGATKFSFKFRPRYGLNALTAPSQLYDYYNPEAHTVVPPARFVIR
ncbi:MAG: hypothetical protein QOE46_3382 [Acidobacteriota bacterium]|jgi:hypothetical protein|nr:hypothetical protein [Acidobacteriota bacterium]